MRYFLLFLLNICVLYVGAQKTDFTVTNISLPPEISYYDNQFSGLYVHEKKLYLMSESRIQDKAEAKLYSILISDLQHKMLDTSFILPYKKIPIKNLDVLRKKMDAIGDEYEGLEAMVIKGNNVYLTVETATPDPHPRNERFCSCRLETISAPVCPSRNSVLLGQAPRGRRPGRGTWGPGAGRSDPGRAAPNRR